jgi:hypothetical protein
MDLQRQIFIIILTLKLLGKNDAGADADGHFKFDNPAWIESPYTKTYVTETNNTITIIRTTGIPDYRTFKKTMEF